MHWRTSAATNAFDVPYATGPLVIPPAAPMDAMGVLAMNLPPLVPQQVTTNWLQLALLNPHEHAMFLKHEYDVRFLLSRRDLFYFLLQRFPLTTIAELFLSPPVALYESLDNLLSTEDRAVALIDWD